MLHLTPLPSQCTNKITLAQRALQSSRYPEAEFHQKLSSAQWQNCGARDPERKSGAIRAPYSIFNYAHVHGRDRLPSDKLLVIFLRAAIRFFCRRLRVELVSIYLPPVSRLTEVNNKVGASMPICNTHLIFYVLFCLQSAHSYSLASIVGWGDK